MIREREVILVMEGDARLEFYYAFTMSLFKP